MSLSVHLDKALDVAQNRRRAVRRIKTALEGNGAGSGKPHFSNQRAES